MTKFSVPLWYHPTTVLLLDDDSVFLSLLKKHINPAFSCLTETNVSRAEAYLKKHAYDLVALAGSLSQQNFEACPTDDQVEVYDVKLAVLRDRLNLPDRFEKSVVAVIDRHMPDMDGLEFCRKIRYTYQLPVKLILLTSATTMNEALTAFNEGVIDTYIEKRGGEAVLDGLNHSIKKLAKAQFCDLGKEVLGGLVPRFTHITDPAFCEIFEKITTEKGIIEFYVLNATGSFVLLDRQGNAHVLLVCAEEDFEMMQDIAEDSDAPAEVIQSLKSRARYPLVLSSEALLLSGKDWSAAMVPVEQLPGKNVFYGVTSQPSLNGLGFDRYKI